MWLLLIAHFLRQFREEDFHNWKAWREIFRSRHISAKIDLIEKKNIESLRAFVWLSIAKEKRKSIDFGCCWAEIAVLCLLFALGFSS